MKIARLMALAAAGVMAFSTAACMKPDAEGGKKGFYSGKPDVRPADTPKSEFTVGNWTAGDKASWESALRSRSMAQNEYNKAPGKEMLVGKN